MRIGAYFTQRPSMARAVKAGLFRTDALSHLRGALLATI